MRRLFVLCLLVSCAHARSGDPGAWLELESEHFVLRTDLPPEDARRSMGELERVRAAVSAAAWHVERPSRRRTQVVELASAAELREFATRQLDGFVSADAFGEPLMVVSAGGGSGKTVLTHELAHVVTEELLVSRPRWLAEGIACYLETLRFHGGKMVLGEPSEARRDWLARHPVLGAAWLLQANPDAGSPEGLAAFESEAWLLVDWLVSTRSAEFDGFLQKLARGDEWHRAFDDAFPDLRGADLAAGMTAWFRSQRRRIEERPAPDWEGDIAMRRMRPAEVHALRADLLRLSPGLPDRADAIKTELALALAVDPGDPLALQLIPGADPGPAVAAHPGDWRAWMLAYDRRKDDSAIETAARLAPHNALVLERLARAQLERGKTEEALRSAQAAVAAAPERPDVLDVAAQSYAALNRCADALTLEQRALDAMPDAASAPGLRKRLEEIDRRCGEERVQRQVLVHPVQKDCALRLPSAQRKDRVKGAITGEFTIREDGSVAGVTVKGEATPAFIEAMQRYFESCRYEPVLEAGVPLAVQSTVQVEFAVRGR